MKKQIIWIFAIAISGSMVSCSDDTTDFTTTEVSETVTSGTWKITYFFDTDKEETDHFNGYSFTFNEDGSVEATNGSTTVTGTWSVVNDDDDDDSPSGTEFNLFFSTPENFEDLNDDWDILERTDTRIKLEDESGGNGGTDELVFEKI